MASKLLQCLPQNNYFFVKSTNIYKSKYSKYFYNTKRYKSRTGLQVREAHNACNKNGKLEENLAAVLHKQKDVKIETKPIPKIKENQVLVQIEVVGIGINDVRFFNNPEITEVPLCKPIVMGHEAAGTVLECGKYVENLKPGDKVAIEPQIGCGKCFACKTGHYNLCQKLKFCGLPPHDGVLCRYFAGKAENCHKLPCSLDFEKGSLLQPLSVVIHALKRVQLTGGDVLLVSCAGVRGLLALLVAKAAGVPKVVIADNNDYNLKKAMELGANCAIKLKGMKPSDVQKKIEEAIGTLPNKTLECSCDEEIMKTSLLVTKSGGAATLVGSKKKIINMPLIECIIREIDILGSYRSCNNYPRAISVLDSGAFDPKTIVTHHFKLKDTAKAFEFASKKAEPFLKIMIHCNPKWEPQC